MITIKKLLTYIYSWFLYPSDLLTNEDIYTYKKERDKSGVDGGAF